MATNLLLRRGTAAEAAAYTGGEGELFVDLDNNQVYVHDGVTAGGTALVGGASIILSDLSVGPEGTASGDGSIAYDNTTGVFTYTPPVIPSDLTDLSISDGTNGQILTTDGVGNFSFTTVGGVSNTLDGLSDVTITSVADGEVLAYDSGTSSWVNTTSSSVNLSALSQSIIPDTNEAYDLGSATNKFRDLYLSSATIYLGNSRISTDASGNIAVPGINVISSIPDTIVSEVAPGDAYNGPDNVSLHTPLTNGGKIIDAVTFYFAICNDETLYNSFFSDLNAHPRQFWLDNRPSFVPSVYTPTVDVDGWIRDITLTQANPFPTLEGNTYGLADDYFDVLNEQISSMYVLDPNTDINDLDSIKSSIESMLTTQGNLQPGDPAPEFINIFSHITNTTTTITTTSYNDLADTPTLATVATSGSYNDLTNQPTIPTDVSTLTDTTNRFFSGSYTDLTDKPTLYSDSDVATYLAANDYDTATNIIASITDSAPATLDTLNELAAALGDDPNFATTVTDSIATKASLSGATFTGDVTFQGLSTMDGITEVVNNKTGATGVVAHDFDTGSIFYHTSLAANFTANITNVPTTNDRTIGIALVLNQGGTAYIPTALQIDGSAVTIKWADASVPSGNANQVDVVSFTLIRTGSAWVALGVLNTFG